MRGFSVFLCLFRVPGTGSEMCETAAPVRRWCCGVSAGVQVINTGFVCGAVADVFPRSRVVSSFNHHRPASPPQPVERLYLQKLMKVLTNIGLQKVRKK